MAHGTFPYARKRSFWRPFLAGVAAPNREGGFVGAFKSGLGGALGQTTTDEAANAEVAREELRRQMEERLFGLRERTTVADEQRAKADLINANRERERTGHTFGFEDWLNADPEKRKQYGEFRNVTDKPAGSPTNVLDMTPEQFDTYVKLKQRIDAVTSPEKPEKPRAAVQELIDAIQVADPNNPEHRARLERAIANPLTPEVGEAARRKLQIGGKEFYRFQPVGPDSSETGGLRYR